SLLANVREERVRVPLQGANDAIMNYAGAAAAAASGLLLAWAGFQGVNVVATIILVPAALLSVSAFRASGGAGTERDLTPQTSSPAESEDQRVNEIHRCPRNGVADEHDLLEQGGNSVGVPLCFIRVPQGLRCAS